MFYQECYIQQYHPGYNKGLLSVYYSVLLNVLFMCACLVSQAQGYSRTATGLRRSIQGT